MTDESTVQTIRDLDIPVIGADFPDAHLYLGSGDHLVLVCEAGEVPRWKNSIGLTPDAARKMAAALIRMADQSERVEDDNS